MAFTTALRDAKTCLVVIDIQEKFGPAVAGFDAVAAAAARLIAGCRMLAVPVIATEQYPRGLGPTVAQVREALGIDVPIIEKTSFSCAGAPGFTDRLNQSGANTVVVCGVETHVCVNQTVQDLLRSGFGVHVARDAVGSRTTIDHETALEKMRQAGAVITTVETCLFELVGDAKHPKFKDVQRLVK